ncbi:DUF5995 family protein, partial [Chryseobacterium sp.]|uniref:DUF5995 family protein n=1 Tax=Chryseobacterium sp. TaxID=1871047 RepID=UPI002FCBD635
MKTIEEVLKKLDDIIIWSKENKSTIGYFACTYRIMTAQVLKGIQQKKFEDNPRMTLLDIAFATRYLDAWENYSKGKKCTNSWYLAFEATKNKDLLILQHIFLGMNAHINLDLGISAASIMPYRKINPLKKDFENINTVISSINQKVQDSLNKICGQAIIPYPPGIPLIMPGELISKYIIDIIYYYQENNVTLLGID